MEIQKIIKNKILTIRITYSAPEKMLSDIDKGLIESLESAGYSWYAQGYDFTTNQRDLCFDKLLK